MSLTPKAHRRQIEAYTRERPRYVTYADALRRVLKAACAASLPEAVIEARAKQVASFAEKCARRFDKYPDGVNQFTDLCGVRVIVQTLSQVQDVRHFIEENFQVVETEDIGMRLGDQEFGYRDRHYIIQLKPARAAVIGFTRAEVKRIGERKAEIQIRTWAQHAWADTLHDRTYKTPIRPSFEAKRTAGLLAALMEDGDRDFDRLAGELDGLVTNYAAYADKETVEAERRMLEVLLQNERTPGNKPLAALCLARTYAALGDHDRVITLLERHSRRPTKAQDELDLALGTALCQVSRAEPTSPRYGQGLRLLEGVTQRTAQPDASRVVDTHKLRSLHARAQSRLGWALEVDESQTLRARECYRLALESEPGNPYYLADMLGFELRCSPADSDITASLRTVIRAAVRTCVEHAKSGIELPFAFFTAGRLRLLLGERETALQCYLRGAHSCLEGKGCFGCEVIDAEIRWIDRVNFGEPLESAHRWARDLLLLARASEARASRCPGTAGGRPEAHTSIRGPVLIVAGGAQSIDPKVLRFVKQPLEEALGQFEGTVISGGTRVGIPGLVGEIAARWRRKQHESKRQVIGYHPAVLAADAPPDRRYDHLVEIGDEGFSPDQILANWKDILAAGIKPQDVHVIGIGGGDVSAVEYRVALTLGATVGVVMDTGGAAEALLKDPLWKTYRNLLPLPNEPATLRAFLIKPRTELTEPQVEMVARGLHARYQKENKSGVPGNLRDFDELEDTYRKANLEQARYAIEILRAAGFVVRESSKPILMHFAKREIEKMARLEHGRWNVERLYDDWRPGPRDNAKKTHDCLTRWEDLSDGPQGIRRFDRNAVEALPRILAQARLEIRRHRSPSQSRS